MMRTQTEKQAGSLHLLYEVKKIQKLLPLIQKEKDQDTRDALMESFLMHSRLLADFLKWKSDRGTCEDIYATDFVPSWPKSSPPPYLASVREAIDKRVAHLTYKRDGGFPFDFSKMCLEIVNGVAGLVGKASPGTLAPEWDAWKVALGAIGPTGINPSLIMSGVTGQTGDAGPSLINLP